MNGCFCGRIAGIVAVTAMCVLLRLPSLFKQTSFPFMPAYQMPAPEHYLPAVGDEVVLCVLRSTMTALTEQIIPEGEMNYVGGVLQKALKKRMYMVHPYGTIASHDFGNIGQYGQSGSNGRNDYQSGKIGISNIDKEPAIIGEISVFFTYLCNLIFVRNKRIVRMLSWNV